MSDTPRTDVISGYDATHEGDTYVPRIFARQLERELALKDHDLLLERDRAEKAEKELSEAQTAYQAAHSELETSNNQLGACRRVANSLQAQVKMLVEAIRDIAIEALRNEGCGETADELEEILAKINE